ncbi:Guanine nucleotide-binding protein G(I)/G(S)/G(O) subunit gamma-3 [Heterocephalus glaber]|nr:Guanine nucleotide-binding protein G(I)/G(S)/G(O) subunit gamma-3 [Heterocephalus glaber]
MATRAEKTSTFRSPSTRSDHRLQTRPPTSRAPRRPGAVTTETAADTTQTQLFRPQPDINEEGLPAALVRGRGPGQSQGRGLTDGAPAVSPPRSASPQPSARVTLGAGALTSVARASGAAVRSAHCAGGLRGAGQIPAPGTGQGSLLVRAPAPAESGPRTHRIRPFGLFPGVRLRVSRVSGHLPDDTARLAEATRCGLDAGALLRVTFSWTEDGDPGAETEVWMKGETPVNSTMSIGQARKMVEQLKIEASLCRIKVSKAAADLMTYCDAHACEDPLITPVPTSENPFREKKFFCALL